MEAKEKTQEDEKEEEVQEEPVNENPVKQEWIVSPYQPEEFENSKDKIENVDPSVAPTVNDADDDT